jgi:hypothetical protein
LIDRIDFKAPMTAFNQAISRVEERLSASIPAKECAIGALIFDRVQGTMKILLCIVFYMNLKNAKPHSLVCPSCGKDNGCKMDASCWCMAKPRIETIPGVGACKCERCFDRDHAGREMPSVPGDPGS